MILLDTEEGGTIECFDGDNDSLGMVDIPSIDDGDSQELVVGKECVGVKRMEVTCKGSCGIPKLDISYCPDLCVPTKYSVKCVESVNPSGKHIPNSPGGGKHQNPDGFYTLSVTNDCDKTTCINSEDFVVKVFAVDGATEKEFDFSTKKAEFGAVKSCDTVKYTQYADGKDPRIQKMGSDPENVKYHLLGSGDMKVKVTIGENEYGDVCKVPKPPARFL